MKANPRYENSDFVGASKWIVYNSEGILMKTSYKVDLTVVGLIQKDLGRYLLRREIYLSFS